jgi:protoporphyrinogen oxidase
VASSRRSLFEREMFGCLESGTATLVDPLVAWLRARPNVELRTGVRVRPIEVHDGRVKEVHAGDARIACDAVISTVALPILDRLVPDQPGLYFHRVRQVKYIGLVCMLLSLKRPFSRNFWTNINDPRISFNGIIEQSTLNENLQRAGLNVVYVPFYLPTTEPRYDAADQDLFTEYTAMLRLMNPDFSASWVKEYHVFRTPHAQPVFTINFVDLVPNHRTPIRGLYVTDSTQFYPEDRTISQAIRQGRTAAAMITADLDAGPTVARS